MADAIRNTFIADWLERILWTAVQAAVALVIVSVDDLDLPVWAVPLIAAALAAIKGYVAKKVVTPEEDSASTVPGV